MDTNFRKAVETLPDVFWVAVYKDSTVSMAPMSFKPFCFSINPKPAYLIGLEDLKSAEEIYEFLAHAHPRNVDNFLDIDLRVMQHRQDCLLETNDKSDRAGNSAIVWARVDVAIHNGTIVDNITGQEQPSDEYWEGYPENQDRERTNMLLSILTQGRDKSLDKINWNNAKPLDRKIIDDLKLKWAYQQSKPNQ